MTSQGWHAASEDDGLLQVARTQVERLSTQAGLPTPVVILIPFIGGPGSPRANANFFTPRGVPTIKVTHAAVRELSSDALEVLLTHELGHFADLSWWARRTRVHVAVASVAVVLIFASLVMAAIADNSNASTTHGWIALLTGLVVAAAVFLVRLAASRAGEGRADVFAARQHGNLASARKLFAAWDKDTPEPRKWRRLRLLRRSHPYRSMRLEIIQAEISRHTPR